MKDKSRHILFYKLVSAREGGQNTDSANKTKIAESTADSAKCVKFAESHTAKFYILTNPQKYRTKHKSAF
ncbi:hypothetical protein ACWIUD_06135 [Helicobacter sp. 23-1044]